MTPAERRLLLAVAQALAAIAPPHHASQVAAAVGAVVAEMQEPNRG